MGREKLPYIQFFVGDWLKDPGVSALTLEEQGAWVRLLCYMHESSERGYLVVNDIPADDRMLSRYLGVDEATAKQIRSKLLEYGVASEDRRGVLYSRRMAKDSELREKRAQAGRKGGKQRGSKQINKEEASLRARAEDDLEYEYESKGGEGREGRGGGARLIPAKKIIDAWNDICGATLPSVTMLTDKRREKIRVRVGQLAKHVGEKAYDPTWWADEIFSRLITSPFCRGENDRGWQATFDWLIDRKDAAVKVMEGQYDDTSRNRDTVSDRYDAL